MTATGQAKVVTKKNKRKGCKRCHTSRREGDLTPKYIFQSKGTLQVVCNLTGSTTINGGIGVYLWYCGYKFMNNTSS